MFDKVIYARKKKQRFKIYVHKTLVTGIIQETTGTVKICNDLFNLESCSIIFCFTGLAEIC